MARRGLLAFFLFNSRALLFIDFVLPAALGAGHRTLTLELYPAFTDPALDLRRIPVHHGVVRHVFGHDSPRPDKGVPADGMTADYRGISADTGAFPDESRSVIMFTGDMSARVKDIGENAGRAAEDIIF